MAGAVGATTLVLLTSAPGLLRVFPDPSTLLANLSFGDLSIAIDYAKGKMKRKVLAAQEAVAGGVPHVVIADGRVDQPVQRALAGQGTHITPTPVTQPPVTI